MNDPALDSNQGDRPASGAERASLRQIDTRGRGLRQHAARGTMINSAFSVGLGGIGMLRHVLVAAFLTQEEFGLWGILVTTLITVSWLKQIGIADRYIQQTEPDQELAYQRAFTLELGLSGAFFVVITAALPLYALAYGHMELIVPGIILATAVPISAFQTPAWIAYRRMQFVRQRVLTAIDPVVAFAGTMILGVLGFGYWALVLGAVAGSLAGALVASLSSPYPMRLRFDRDTLRDYSKFSWPLFGLGATNLITVQGTLLVANHAVGLAGVGAIGLASTIASFADRVDSIVSQTIYPAVCAVADRVDLMFEAFVKSNRITLMWAMPFGVGLALFAGDLVTFVLGESWRSAVPLIAAIGVIVGFSQVAFNWTVFMRAVNNTKPIFTASLFALGTFVLVTGPAVFAFGLTGYAVGFAITAVIQILVRGYFLGRLFPGFKVLRHLLRAMAPSVPAAGVILLLRLLLEGDRTLAGALAELGLYIGATILFTYLFERALLREIIGYLRGTKQGPLMPTPAKPAGET